MCVPLLYAKTNKYCKDLTVKEFDTGHWAQLQAPDQFNADLLEWINGFIGKA